MNAHDERLGQEAAAWLEERLANSPGRAPEQCAGVHQGLAGAPSLPASTRTTPTWRQLP
ncbi:hypothetical protein [Streptomyces vinaceus]|uniref:hypothetical protein n=1 Tax=Streptomyces vinaceus TaxID=1960 RepID=UPI0036CF5F52